MVETIEVPVGQLYADIHEQFEEQLGEQYMIQFRQDVEDILHSKNQQIERQQEAMEAESEEFDFDGDGEVESSVAK